MTLTSGLEILEIIAVSDGEWCIYDRRVPAPASSRGVAYISRLHDSRFMVTGLDGEHGWVLFREYAEALDAVRARLTRSGHSRRPAA